MCFLATQILVQVAILMLGLLHMALEFIAEMEAQNLIHSSRLDDYFVKYWHVSTHETSLASLWNYSKLPLIAVL